MASKASTSSVSTAESNAAEASGTDGSGGNKIEQHTLHAVESTSDERRERIAVAAYRLAESRGFAPGGELEDWLRAEREIGDSSPPAP